MSPMFLISITLVLVAGVLWYQEQNQPADVDHTSPFAFAFGILVRLLLVVVMMVVMSLGMSTFWISL